MPTVEEMKKDHPELLSTSVLMQGIAENINRLINPKGRRRLGFAVLVFEFNKPGIANYASNAKREEIIAALREAADRLETRDLMSMEYPFPEEHKH